MLAEAAAGLRPCCTVYGAELSLGLSGPQNGVPDPEGDHLLVLARGVEGYHRLAAAMTDAHLRGDEKGRPVYDLDELAERGRGHWVVLTGCRKGSVPPALAQDGPAAAAEELDRLTGAVRDRPRGGRAVAAPAARRRRHQRDCWPGWPREHGLPVVAAGNVHHATPARRDGLGDDGRGAGAPQPGRDGRLARPVGGGAPAQRRRGGRPRWPRYPDAVPRSVALADELAFDLRKASPRLPKHRIPAGHTADSWLRELADRGLRGAVRRHPARRRGARRGSSTSCG